jgi:chromosomal replication initiator protein
MHVLRRREPDPDSASEDLRKRHTEHLVALWRAGVSLRLIDKHRLDDPRLTDAVRTLMMRVAMERKKTAGVEPRGDMATLLKLSNFAPAPPASSAAVSATDGQGNQESLQLQPQAPRDVTDPEDRQRMVDLIRKRICAEFHLAELRDPNLTARSRRQIFAFPRQLAMFLVRQLTGASLQEIARQFGGKHHTTVLHSINKIERMRQLDEELNGAIRRLMNALQL